jgi:hypothetical protein
MSSDYTLAYGTHATPQDGRCAMEWVSYLAGEPHGDEPVCVSPVLRALCIALNDGLGDDPRQRLRPYLARTIGTSGDGLDPARAWMAMDWLIRTYTPAWLRLADLRDEAQALAELAPVIDERSLQDALALLEHARRRARAARAQAFREAGPSRAPRTGAWANALAAGVAGREAAWSCAGAAAWAAARIAVGDMAGDRARAAARAAAGDAAAIAGRVGSGSGRAADGGSREQARSAARDTLAPTLAALAESAIELLDRMLPTESLTLSAPGPIPEAVFTTSV